MPEPLWQFLYYPVGGNLKKEVALAIVLLVVASLSCVTLLGEPAVQSGGRAPATVVLRASPAPCASESCFESCLSKLTYSEFVDDVPSIGGNYVDADVMINLVLYPVKDGHLGEPQALYVPEEFRVYQENLAAHQRIWDYASFIFPPEYLKWITKYMIFSSSETTAWIGRDDLDSSRWEMGVDIQYAEHPADITAILIHEFGHLLTLNIKQIPDNGKYYHGWDHEFSDCEQFSDPNGCAVPESYINLFYQEFWIDIYDEWYETVIEERVESEDEYDLRVDRFYEKYRSQFARRYAATNIHEDMAESFEAFILRPKPSGNGVADEKVNFYYRFPELVAMRSQMLQNICLYIQR